MATYHVAKQTQDGDELEHTIETDSYERAAAIYGREVLGYRTPRRIGAMRCTGDPGLSGTFFLSCRAREGTEQFGPRLHVWR